MYAVSYGGGGAKLYFALKVANSSPPSGNEDAVMRSVTGHITSDGWPSIQATWKEDGQNYIVQASGVSRDDLLKIVAGLRPTT